MITIRILINSVQLGGGGGRLEAVPLTFCQLHPIFMVKGGGLGDPHLSPRPPPSSSSYC